MGKFGPWTAAAIGTSILVGGTVVLLTSSEKTNDIWDYVTLQLPDLTQDIDPKKSTFSNLHNSASIEKLL